VASVTVLALSQFCADGGRSGKQRGLVLTKTLQLCASEQNYYEYMFTDSYKQTLLALL